MRTTPQSPAAGRLDRQVLVWCLVVFAAGLLVRSALVIAARPADLVERPETVQIALSLLTTGRYADAYGVGSGPTAHCAPLYPILLSILFRIFGTGAGGALAMSLFGSMAAAAGFALLPLLAVAGGLSRTAGALAGMAGALLPVNYWSQTGGAFDAPLTATALVALCILVCRVWSGELFTKPWGVVFGIAAGIACLLNSGLIPLLAAWAIVSVLRYRLQLRRVLTFLAVAAFVVIAILTPWAIRNYRALGSLVFTRSDFWMELDTSNNDVLTADLERNVRMPEYGLFQPFMGPGQFAEVQRLGEVAYQRTKQRQVLAWIPSHKERFLSLTLERFRLFWAPNMRRPWQSAFEAGLTLFGLCGLAMLLWRRYDFFWVAAPALMAYPAVYYLIQVSPRYRFPVEPVLFLLAGHLFAGILEALTSFRASTDPSSTAPPLPA